MTPVYLLTSKATASKSKKRNRQSPSDSAKDLPIGTRKKGNDGNFWIIVRIKNNVRRWKREPRSK